MTKLSLEKGRILQKLKTREKLILKANEMLAQGQEINVESVARAADISKATAYRYFSNTQSLQREASLQLKAKTKENLFSDLDESDLRGRIDRLIEYHFNLFIENENEFRLFLSSVISESLTKKGTQSRGGRRISLIEEALKPLKHKLSDDDFDKTVNTLSIFLGIESITVLKDLCRLTEKDVLSTWRWAIYKIVF